MEDTFGRIHRENFWANPESVSGAGSTLEATKSIRMAIPDIIYDFEIKTMLDLPCGDYHWFPRMNLDVDYIGGDIVPEIIERNKHLYPKLDFRVMDITKTILPQVDLILVRDCLGHFSNRDVQASLRNLRRSGSKWLLATTFPRGETLPYDIETGTWRPLDLGYGWGLGKPLMLISERETKPGVEDKSLGLWRLNG